MQVIFFIILLLVSHIAHAQLPVYVSILPQKYFVEQIGAEHVDVSVMVQAGHSPATYEPTPQQMVKLSQTPLYFKIGVPFEKVWLNKLQQHNPNMLIVNVAQGIELQAMPDIESLLDEEHHDHEKHHEHGEFDPHVWLSPRLVKIMAQHILKQLTEHDPERAAIYQQNYAQFVQKLEQLDTDIQQMLTDIENRKFMVFHPSWGYFAKDYDLQQIPIEVEGKTPNAKDLARLMDYAKQQNIQAIFVQKQFSQKVAKTIADSIQAQFIVVDPLAENYIENLTNAARTFAQAMK
jgi:zinc transport system substrate-binding protein